MSFYKRRFIRIYPVLASALILTTFIDALSAAWGATERLGTHTATQFFCNLGAAQGLLCQPFGSNGPLWSLAIEIQFYVLYPALILIRGKIGGRPFMALIVAITLAGVWFESVTKQVFFPQYLLSWWIGAYVAERPSARKDLTGPMIIIGVVLSLIGLTLSALHFNFASFYVVSAVTAVAIRLILAARQPSTRSLGILNKLLASVGGWSYSVYILHVPLLILFGAVFLDAGKSDLAVTVPVAAAVAIAICYFYFRLVEFPFFPPKSEETQASSLLG